MVTDLPLPTSKLKHIMTHSIQHHISPMSHDRLMEICRGIRHVALDMDGTIYLGASLFPFTKNVLKAFDDAGIGYSFLTNNPTRSVNDYLLKLQKLGIETTPERMYTTAVATIDYIKAEMPDIKRIYAVGTPSMIKEFEEAGFEICGEDTATLPDALIVAFDTTITYPRLCHAAWLATQGVPYIATNPDRVCPTDQPTVLVDCGSLCKCIEHATGRTPDIVIGKPNRGMLDAICHRHGLQSSEIAMVGDRIYTDVATARNAGAFGVLVLSGETTLDTAMNSDPVPPLTVPSLVELLDLILESRKTGS